MIHARVHTDDTNKVTEMHISLTAESVQQFRNILNRALNCAPPEGSDYKDWFEVADKLEGRT